MFVAAARARSGVCAGERASRGLAPLSDGLSTAASRRHPVCRGRRRCRSVRILVRPRPFLASHNLMNRPRSRSGNLA
ncbi:jg14675 [Pararge aegeria aegeria]|uniref:Jg14675 protein n=1 Tax=Pararge aegeria aegeria TaxID=348720 RepID=A0A8S4RDR4_9NEOP|nr:jg14675 [Pararge aegeria aegeria]